MQRRRGFTLIEVLIATSLLAVIGLAIAETLRAARDAERRLQIRSARRAQDRVLLDRMARDLRSLMPPGGIYASGLVGENVPRSGSSTLSSSQEEAEASSSGAHPPFDRRDRLTIAILPGPVRYGSPLPAVGWGAIQSVIWEVDDDASTPEAGLVRRPTTIRDPIAGSIEEAPEVIGPGVCGLALRYWDGSAWQDTWDSSAQDLIPRAIEISLAVRDEEGIHLLVGVVAPLAARPSTLVEPTK